MGFPIVLAALLQVVGPSAGKQNPPDEPRPELSNPLGGIKQHYQPPPPPAAEDVQAVTLLRQAAASEIKSGAMARQQAQSRQVRAFGDRLLRDQVQANLLLREYIRAHALELPEVTGDASHLASLRGTAFDREFVQTTASDDDRLLAELLPLRLRLRDPNLRDLVTRLTPIVEQHRQLARNLEKGHSW
jgi:putative membrane protein